MYQAEEQQGKETKKGKQQAHVKKNPKGKKKITLSRGDCNVPETLGVSYPCLGAMVLLLLFAQRFY